MKVQSALAHYW